MAEKTMKEIYEEQYGKDVQISKQEYLENVLEHESQGKELDSIVFFEIHSNKDTKNYHNWLDALIREWVIHEGNEEYKIVHFSQWNVENPFYGYFGGRLYMDVKLARYDGTERLWMRKRGIKISHHYNQDNLDMVQWIAECFEEFLKKKEYIEYLRYDFYRCRGMELVKPQKDKAYESR